MKEFYIDDFGYRRFVHGEGKKTPVDRTKLTIAHYPEGDEDEYNVKYGGRIVGYIHCKSHYTEVICPDEDGEDIVYEAEIGGFYKFMKSEKSYHLTKAWESVARWLNDNGFWFFTGSDPSKG